MKPQKAKMKGNEGQSVRKWRSKKAKRKGNEAPKGQKHVQKTKMKGNEAKKAPRITPKRGGLQSLGAGV